MNDSKRLLKNRYQSTWLLLSCAFLLLASGMLMAEADWETGTVAETIDVENYVYIRLEEPDMWIAAPPFPVSKGDQVEYIGGMEMRDFYSKSLDRTFATIFFMQNVRPAGQGGEQNPHGIAQGNGSELPQIPPPVSVESPKPGEVSPLPGGKTIAEIVADAGGMQDQSVSLRAMVTKVSANVMGKNWITLQDGTGTAPNDKLLATSLETVNPGDLVTVQGVIRNDVDLGSGYRYAVLLENASFE